MLLYLEKHISQTTLLKFSLQKVVAVGKATVEPGSAKQDAPTVR
jgi:hypothetical protein